MIDPARAPKRPNSESPALRVQRRDLGGGITVVALEGEVDLASAPTVKATLAELPADVTRIVVDLSGVEYMDSTGLGVLIGVRRRLPDPSGIALAGTRTTVRALFELTGLDFQMFETADEAVAAFEQAAARERRPPLSTDSAMVVGLASTALPFAESPVAEAERWLRVLRLHGQAGRALTALGLSEAPLSDAPPPPESSAQQAVADPDRDPIAAVVGHAKELAFARNSATVGTADLLQSVIAFYGEDFAWVLRARGSDPAEVLEQLDENQVTAR